MKLDDDQSVDSAEPDYTQTANRVGTDHSYFMVGLTVAVIIVIAGTSTWMRWSNLNAEQTREAMGTSQGADVGNPFATAPVIPAELSSSQKAADDRAKAEESSSTRSEGAAAFITLGVIFVVTQIVGIFGGFAWGLAAVRVSLHGRRRRVSKRSKTTTTTTRPFDPSLSRNLKICRKQWLSMRT